MKIFNSGVEYDVENPTVIVSMSGRRDADQPFDMTARVDRAVLMGESMGCKWSVELTASEMRDMLTLIPEDLRRSAGLMARR